MQFSNRFEQMPTNLYIYFEKTEGICLIMNVATRFDSGESNF